MIFFNNTPPQTTAADTGFQGPRLRRQHTGTWRHGQRVPDGRGRFPTKGYTLSAPPQHHPRSWNRRWSIAQTYRKVRHIHRMGLPWVGHPTVLDGVSTVGPPLPTSSRLWQENLAAWAHIQGAVLQQCFPWRGRVHVPKWCFLRGRLCKGRMARPGDPCDFVWFNVRRRARIWKAPRPRRAHGVKWKR